MKKTVLLIVSVLILIMAFSAFVSAERYVTVILDEEVLEFDVKPQIINGRTMVPLRKIFESMGAVVDWDGDTRTAFAEKNTRFVEAQIDNYEMTINGVSKRLDTAPMLLGGRTLVPVRFVAEAFGVVVEWDDESSTVTLTSPEKIPLTSVAKMSYQYDLTPYVSIEKGDYTGLEYTSLSAEVSQEEVTASLSSLMEEYVEYSDVERACAIGDAVSVDYKGFINGKELENGSEEGAEFVLGNTSFIPGFEDGIIGHCAGESFEVEVTFPDDYGVEELNGVKAVFKMKLNYVREVKYPQLTDSFIASITEYATIGEYLKAKKTELENTKAQSNIVQQKNELFSKIMENVEIKGYPKEEYEAYYNEYCQQYTSLAEQYGLNLEMFVNAYAQITMEEFYGYAKEYAESTIKMELAFYSIAKAEGVSDFLTKADYIEYLDNISKEYGMSAEEFERMYGVNAVVNSLVYEKTLDFVLKKGTAV